MTELAARETVVLDLIDETELVGLTRSLIDAGGENPGGTEGQTVAVLERACHALRFTVETLDVAPGRPNLTATLPGAGDGPGLMVLGHSDVVPAGDGWTRRPFEASVAGGRIFGRGATDMKGGLAAAVIAMAALSRSGIQLPGPVQLVCTVDEEDLGIGIRDFVTRSSPYRFAGCVVAEPTDLETVVACRGASYIEVRITGRAAHSGRPADGRNAIDAAAAIIDLVRADQRSMLESPDPLLGTGTWNTGLIEGGQGISVVAPSATVSFDRRLMPGEDAFEVAKWLRGAISEAGIDSDGITVDVEVTMAMPGFETDRDHPLAAQAAASVVDAGGATSITGWTAACDGGFINRDLGIPAIVLGPGGLNDQAHRPDESVSIAELVIAAKAYALLALRLL
ncbi:acetylornithine deacetylase [Williamsia limnetica]|uniref:Acetylornithine deacetylase n=1 Tax=Williamsia limnetica TaxID=882452 RepID=A0A318RRN6_WILLI|nr:M20/M25/M40 family metallo-hydrolase [Williamsia limnetica]PYE19896.1 acetylornithine deacetylase [Williamsia limnetica]